MSKYTVNIKVKPFVKQWLVHHYGEPVEFPPMSVENSTIRRFLSKQPYDVVTTPKDDETIAVYIPDSKQKPVVTYNYLGKHAREALVECIEDNFKLQMWKDLNDLRDCGCSVLKAIQAWCEMNGISIDYDYTIKMRYQRLRNSYLKNNIDFREKTRVRENNTEL